MGNMIIARETNTFLRNDTGSNVDLYREKWTFFPISHQHRQVIGDESHIKYKQ